MRSCFVALLALAPVARADEPKKPDWPEAVKKELKRFEGKWKMVRFAGSGVEGKVDQEVVFEFKGDGFTITRGTKIETFGLGGFDLSTNPKCVDLIEKRAGKPDRALEGAYRFDGAKLQIAHALPNVGKSRPTTFTKDTPNALVWTLERIEK